MEPLTPGRPRGTRLALVSLGLFALLVVVGVASRAGFGASSDAAPSQGYLDYTFSIFLVLFVAAIPIAIYSYWLLHREGSVGTLSRRPVWQTVSLIVLFTVVVVALMELHKLRIKNPFARIAGASKRIGKGKHGKHAAVQEVEPHFRWPVLLVFGILLVAAVAAYVVMRRRRVRRTAAALEQPEVKLDVAQAISDAIEDLEAEPDARKAVIAAYARMEGVLGRHGLPRRPSETPFEYLGRALVRLRARAESVRRLTSLFERAKFSRHEIDVGMKGEAISALATIRDELRAAAGAGA